MTGRTGTDIGVGVQQRFDEMRDYLRSQPCDGMGDEQVQAEMDKHGWDCIDVVPARTARMCLRCRLLLYMDWTHGFPKVQAPE